MFAGISYELCIHLTSTVPGFAILGCSDMDYSKIFQFLLSIYLCMTPSAKQHMWIFVLSVFYMNILKMGLEESR